ncbi:MucR family transcriptional regulator [Bosea rubneri]|uniref:MucR family transcriptional regulator n=1 Tax=Bosea rubneri TaxID=3075434 RepID=A0ABU3SFY2_9HYPH|nr:MucR family transcriptional regulator [Bosea sp. ZW T0_25]MDU0343704.1 MucR family transcriptional regulator [Bosea sp. ZW T0_25]
MIEDKEVLAGFVANIVSAFVSHNSVPTSDLPALIASTHSALAGIGQPPAPVPEERPDPAVPIRKSITPDYLICLEDGLKFKSLKRHLRTKYDLSPEEYRVRWNLPADYPMVAPAYAEARSKLAKSIGLGRKAATPPVTEPTTATRVRKPRKQ